MYELTHFDFFAGIMGFSLGFEAAGFRTIGYSELDPDASLVCAWHHPGLRNFGDIRTMRGSDVLAACGWPMVITGGVPCQPASALGQMRGTLDERWIWPEFIRMGREIRPRYVVAENPPSLLVLEGGRAWNGIVSELVEIGYDCQWDVFPAAAFGAGHFRERLYLLATDPDRARLERHAGDGAGDGRSEARRPVAPPDLRKIKLDTHDWWAAQSPVQPLVDGLPSGLVEDAIRCVGNSVVPQIPFYLASVIAQHEKGK